MESCPYGICRKSPDTRRYCINELFYPMLCLPQSPAVFVLGLTTADNLPPEKFPPNISIIFLLVNRLVPVRALRGNESYCS